MDVLRFTERSIRGGLAFCSTRYAKAHVDKSARGNHLLYIDACNLYGCAQSMPLPVGEYAFLSDDEIAAVDWREWKSVVADQPYGYMVEVTLDYPKKLHRKHSHFPLASEKRVIEYNMLSPYTKDCMRQNEGKKKYSEEKLTGTFLRRNNYIW